jgi:dynein heavy chain
MSKWATKREGKDDAGGGKSGLSKSLNLSLLKKPSSGAAKSTVDAYKWDLSSPAVSRMPKSPEERRRRAKYMADEGKKAGEKEDRSGGSLEPKVFVPYVTRPGHTPRRVAVERKRQFYASQDLTRILQDHGVTSETMVQTGLDENVPMQDLNNILPLTLFDDETYEQYQPTEWIMLGAGNVPAKTMFAGEWVACTVKSYDEATSLFQIEINGAQDNRTRLEICFDVEDPFQFAKRLAAASAGRKLAEGLIRYNLYVDCMPTDDVADLDSEQVNRIVKIALHSRALQQSENDTSQLLNEIHMDYARTMNKIVFDANLKGGSEATMMGDLQLPEQLPANPPPQFGCLQLPESNFSQKFSSFAFSSFLTKEEVIDALQGVQQECNAIKKVKFFNTTNRKSLNLEEFQVAQSQALKISGRKIKEDWTSGVVSHIRTSLQSCGKGHFNIYESKNDVYKHSKLKKLMQRVNFLMQSSLQNVVRDSVKLYGDFIKLAMDAEVKLIDIKTAVNDFIRDSTLSSDAWDVANTLEGLKRPPALFFLEVQPTAEPICLNQAEVDEAAAAIKAWKPPKDDKNAKCPIQRVAAEMGRIFEYTTPLESYGKVIMVALDNVLNEMGKIEQTEKLLMDRLFWSSTPTLQSISPNEDEIVNLRNEIQAKIDECLKHPIAYLKFLNHKKDYRKSEYIKFLNIDEAAIMEKITPETPEDIDLAACKKVIDYHTLQANKYKDKLPDFAVRLGMFTCNLASIRTTLVKKHLNIAAQATALIAKCNKSNGASIVKKYEQIRKRLQQIPTDVEDVASMNEFIEGISAEMNQFGPNLVAINEACRILDGYGVKDAEQFSMKWKIIGWPKKIFIQVESTEQVQSEKKMEYAAEMEDEQVIFEQTLISLEQECAQFQGYSDVGRVQMVAKHVKSLDEKLKKAEEDARTFNSREILFGREPTEYTKVNEIRKEFTPYQGLWSNVSDWLQFHEGCMTGPFDEVDGINLEDVVDRYSKGINKAYKTFEKAGNKACMDIASQIKSQISEFQPHTPWIMALRNQGMRERHWTELSEKIGTEINPENGDFTIQKAFDLEIFNHTEAVQKVGDKAGKENQIEVKLDEMEAEWAEIDLDVAVYRETGTCTLRGVDELIAILDEQITMTQAMMFSAFKGPFEERIEEWNVKLATVSDVLEEWIKVQRSWMYLQPIFESDDIMKQLPQESKRFIAVDKNWRATMTNAQRNPNALKFCANEKLLMIFTESNKFLDMVQKGLSDYLETKRSVFARFYFLSNDELLSILSETKDVSLVQPHLKKCYEGINKVVFGDNNIIEALVSREKEKMPCATPVDPNGKGVEFWMCELEDMMKISVRESIKACIADYLEKPRSEWMQVWPGMCIINGGQLHWTTNMEREIAAHGAKGVEIELAREIQQLDDIIILVRGGKLSKNQKTAIGALTVMDVHARDVVKNMVTQKVSSKNDFLWLSQLRYYWEEDDQLFWRPFGTHDNLWIEMVASKRSYGYEYLGNTFRLVITPLTDKCYLTLMGALQMILGGAPAGPAGTGKTETVKDLAKALAKQCVVFNCGDGLDYLAMAKFFKGLASCGAWACFDEFNRIHIEVLSVVAQQIITLQNACKLGLERIDFEGSNIRMDDAFAVYITMNPGYAGRTELPENLAACFRPVAMMVPDYALIGEIMLIAFGFSKAKECGAKMVSTFTLCSEQLSNQCHYDYGMRAVKTVIVAAGTLKGQEPEAEELQLLLRALQDVNLPKFLAQDLPLFEGIISDLFPGIARPDIDYGALMQALQVCTERAGLQGAAFFLSKNIQLFETICVRHGLMVVGPTGGGKSENIDVLSAALTMLCDSGVDTNPTMYQHVKHFKLNPKAITMSQLYGAFDPNTREFIDGVLPNLYRNAAADTTMDRKFVLFDGPVDAIWIENMNTVLDDNKKLCLNSGEMLGMSDTMSMIFEVNDLSVASPATISRCGMVYMEPESLTLSPLVFSWIERLPELLPESLKSDLLVLFDTYLEAGLTFMRRFTKESAVTVNCNIAQSLMRIIDTFVLKLNVPEGFEPPKPEVIKSVADNMTSIFLFALVWSVGATTDEIGRSKFSNFVRSECSNNGVAIPFPTAGLVYDYCIDLTTGKWVEWLTTVEEHEISGNQSFAEMVIPTKDSIRNIFLLEKFLTHRFHVMCIGPTGTGKTINIESYLMKNMADKYVPLVTSFSAQTSANDAQKFLDTKMEKRKKGVYGPSAGKQYIIFVDDFNMPQREEYGAQPPVELVRQAMGQVGWYDTVTLDFKKIIDCTYVMGMGPPGGGRNPITERVKRLCNIVGYVEMDEASQKIIFNSILGHFLADFEKDVSKMSSKIVDATSSFYNKVSNDLLPTPIKPHYTFNLRDFAKVIQGVMMAHPKRCISGTHIVRVYVHECYRVFRDRMINYTDSNWLRDQVQANVEEELGFEWGKCAPESDRLFFGNFMEGLGADPKIYDEVPDLEKLTNVMYEYLSDYNAESKSPMNLVLFLDAIEHVSRIARVLSQPRGNCLLLGVGGSGRQSLTRLATFVSEYQIFQVEIAKGYGQNEWREDLKQCLMIAGLQNKPITFLFSDVQIVFESMVEDINNILNSGDIPGIYAGDEEDQIMNACRNECQKKRIAATKINIFAQYLLRVRKNIHVCLCMSPIGEAFRTRLRMFPSLVNCCTIDWFMPWPEEALRSVAMDKMTVKDMGLGEHLSSVVDMFKVVHQVVEQRSEDFLNMLGRRNYVTPTSYLELLSTYIGTLGVQRKRVAGLRDRLGNGVEKISSTKVQVAAMQEQLTALQPVLKVTQGEVDEMMVQISADKEAAGKTRVTVEAQAEAAEKKEKECKTMAADAQRDLDEALPALDEAVKCLNALKKADIDEVKSLGKPPKGVILTAEATCVMFEVKPNRVKDPEGGTRKVNDYWGPAKEHLFKNPKQFIERLIHFDKDNIPEKVIEKIDPYIVNPSFTPAEVKKASKACTAICMWCRAMHKYYHVARSVEPKRLALASATEELNKTMALLAEAQATLAAVMARLDKLEADYAAVVQKKDDLANEVETCQIRLASAMKLISGLGGEEVRWRENVVKLSQDFINLDGDIIIASGAIAYLGAFTADYRESIQNLWIEKILEEKIPCTEGTSLVHTLSVPTTIRQWNIWGLPTDNLSTENGIVMSMARRWPLCIDPQGQANRYIKTMGKDLAENGMEAVKLTDKNFLRSLENGVRFGRWVVLENIFEVLDAALEPILQRNVFKQGGQDMMRIGDNNVPYNDSFRFFITTKLPNPHYTPETCVKVTVLNFAITPRGLQEQLLGVAIAEELPEIQEQKELLVVNNAKMNKQLDDIEDRILFLLENCKGNILDDVEIIETLDQAKITSNEIAEKMKAAAITEKEIDEQRSNYKPLADHASVLFFTLSKMANIDPMYQYSLQWFTILFIRTTQEADMSDDQAERINILKEYFTYLLYDQVCRSLFEEHKLLFSFLVTIALQESRGKVEATEWRFLITGQSLEPIDVPNPDPSWIIKRMWTEVTCMSGVGCWKGFAEDFPNHVKEWKSYFDSPVPHTLKFPGEWDTKLNQLQKLGVLRTLRPDKVILGIQDYIAAVMGQRYIEPPPFDLPLSFVSSSISAPMVFILSVGTDPMKVFLEFAAEKKMSKKYSALSLGQGQGPKAEKMMENAQNKGEWTLLQNAHLCISWLPTLEQLCEDMDPEKVHKDYRLWLTSMPTPSFPVSILQNGVKMTNEPPKGLRANMNQTYYKLDDEKLNLTDKPTKYKKLLFGLSFFHALVIERKKFGPLGWNIPYAFNETDLDICTSQLQVYLEMYDEVQFSVLDLLAGFINYGGRVTDDKDLRTIEVIMRQFYNPKILTDDYKFSESGLYYSFKFDPDDAYNSYVEYIRSLPINPEPEAFGMHDNANITCDQNELYTMLKTIVSLGGAGGGGGGSSREEMTIAAAAEMADKLPEVMDEEATAMAFPVDYNESMNTLLCQEQVKFNNLLRVMKHTLFNVQRALKGLLVMSSDLETVANAIFTQDIPVVWESVGYPSLMPLTPWFLDLLKRVEFMEKWIEFGTPKAFWISGFFFPQAFLTGTLQNFARKYQKPIDTIDFDFKFRDEKKTDASDITERAPDGAYVYGLFIQGARWNYETHGLDDPRPKELYDQCPVMHLDPVQDREDTMSGIYRCPVYKTLTRAGMLSTTGHSTNFVCWFEFPCEGEVEWRKTLCSETNAQRLYADSAKWIKAGVACFCALAF